MQSAVPGWGASSFTELRGLTYPEATAGTKAYSALPHQGKATRFENMSPLELSLIRQITGSHDSILEIALRYATDAYRVVLAVQLGKRIYVLHAFQKKMKKGVGAPKSDVDLIKR